MLSSKKEEFNINAIIKSTIGLNNAGESCYMASIIQILIHLEKFLDSLKKYYTKQNKLYTEFYKFLKKLEQGNCETETVYKVYYKYIEIIEIAKVYNSINHKFKGTEGNNPMIFFKEFINDLNKNILSLFEGEKEIQFIENEENKEKTTENFIFYLVTLDKNNQTLGDYFLNNLYKEKEIENEKDEKIIEKITKFPEILVINLELEISNYKPENNIVISKNEKDDDFMIYELKAINKYSEAHSIA